ncbi:TonB family protein [Mariprofundus sp. NF]|nr:TonB family protein [Mariprofundus sp. NF]
MSLAVVTPSGRAVRYGAIGLSLLLHGALFANFGGAPAGVVQPPNPSITRLSFLTPAVEPVLTPEVVPEIKPEKKIVEPTPEPVKKVVKKKVRKKVAEPVKEVVQEQVSEPQPVAVAQPMAAAAVATPQIDEGLIKRETERYLTEVMAHIEQHKWYPKAARRRGIEGEVHVRFTLFPDGTAQHLIVENGPSLLVAAARQAVEKAIPMPTPPAKIHCPLECEFRMAFNLNAS